MRRVDQRGDGIHRPGRCGHVHIEAGELLLAENRYGLFRLAGVVLNVQ